MRIKKFLTLFAATTFLSIVTISNIESKILKAEGETTFDEFVGNWISKDATLSLAGGKNQVVVTQNADSVKDYTNSTNQWTRVTYKNPLDLTDNGIDTPFVQYTIQSNDSSKYDFEALIFTLSDTIDLSKAKNAVSVAVFLGNPNSYMNSNTWSYAAKGFSESQTNKQRFSSYAAASNDNEGAQGIMHWNEVSDSYLTNSNNDKNPGNLATMGLYYDVNTKTVWTDDFWEAKIDTRIADGYKAKSTGSSKYDRVLIRNLSYGHDENPDTNLQKYCNYATGFGDGFNTILEKAYLSITTVRSFHSYCDPFGDTIPVAYTGTMFKGKPRDSKNGARYFIRSIDGCSTETVDGKFTKDRLQITAQKPIFDGEKVVLKQSYASGVFKVEGVHPTYVKVFDKDNNEVEVNGLDNGKFKEGCNFTPTNSGTYTVKYFENEE